MNKNGQALVLFIFLVPVFLFFTAIFVDMGINSYHDKKIKSITTDVIDVLLDNESLENVNYENEDEIKEKLKKQAIRIYDANEISTEYLSIDILYGGEISLFNTYEHYSFMNSLFGKGNGMRKTSVEVVGRLDNGEKIIEFKDGSDED